nr:roadblock/LC7 domain-containing protein [Mastigocoleus testarum]
MLLSKIVSLLKRICSKIFTWWGKLLNLFNSNSKQINSEAINHQTVNYEDSESEQINSEQINSEQTNSGQTNQEQEQTNKEQINPDRADSEAVNLEKINHSLTESLKTENQQDEQTIILREKNMINISMLQDTLQNFVSSTPDVQGVALVSPDGLSLSSVLPSRMDEERTAAMSASILSLGERIGGELARGNVERIVVEGEKGYSMLVGCGSEAVLLVLANSSAKKGLLFLETKRVVTQIVQLIS